MAGIVLFGNPDERVEGDMIERHERPLTVPGVRLGVASAGIKRAGREDLLLIEACEGALCAAVFTRNAFCAAPVQIAKKHLSQDPRWLLVNSGNANAGTGDQGLADALQTCAQVAALAGSNPERVLPFSTGVIGEYLPLERIEAALPEAFRNLNPEAWESAAAAIMTTDTRPKIASRSFRAGDDRVVVTGIAKGSGMIHPDMATMLAFIATNALCDLDDLQSLLFKACDQSFNCITVDGDTSTNDACVLLASGQSMPLVQGSSEFALFEEAVRSVCLELAEAIVRDGEGATKLIRITVEGARDEEEARRVGKTIAQSPLVKTAFFASDPNWGRILAAVGRAGCEDLDIQRVDIWLDEVRIVERGERCRTYLEADGARVMAQAEIEVRVSLGRGVRRSTVLTCDFSYDYVRINAEYRT